MDFNYTFIIGSTISQEIAIGEGIDKSKTCIVFIRLFLASEYWTEILRQGCKNTVAPRDQKVYVREWDFHRRIMDGKVYSGVCCLQFLRATKFQKYFCTL